MSDNWARDFLEKEETKLKYGDLATQLIVSLHRLGIAEKIMNKQQEKIAKLKQELLGLYGVDMLVWNMKERASKVVREMDYTHGDWKWTDWKFEINEAKSRSSEHVEILLDCTREMEMMK